MSRITTVCGDIAPEELGYTDMHEHVMFDGTDMGNICRPGMPGNLPIQWEDKISLENIGLLKRNFTLCRDAMNLDDEEVMTGEVADYKESGGDSLLELSVPGIRLDVAAIKRISEKTGVNIITATGFYIESSWMGRFDGWKTADFYNRIMDEFENGIEMLRILESQGISNFTYCLLCVCNMFFCPIQSFIFFWFTKGFLP